MVVDVATFDQQLRNAGIALEYRGAVAQVVADVTNFYLTKACEAAIEGTPSYAKKISVYQS